MKIGIFCGSSAGIDPVYKQAAKNVGSILAQQSIEIVYGGGHVGLMGAVADAALASGGEVTGVMPKSLVDKEIAHTGLTSLVVVNDMHERKQKMSELSDGFIALPGGAGTFEEIIEQWTWAQLGIHSKPCAFLNVAGYYNPMKAMTTNAAQQQFIQQAHSDMVIYSDDIERIISSFSSYEAPPRKWL